MIAASLHGLELAPLPGRMAADPLPAAAEHGMAVRVVVVTEQRRTLHLHPHSAELIHVVEGRGEHWQGDERRAVAAGDLVLVPAGVPHATVAAPGERLRLLCAFPHPDLAANQAETATEVRFGG
ncbi:MAG: cupin domain-containing protein [Solirubrobacteraceae bacterium]|nr:cupin domain-containing protein [Solirubrobacteraceae bacterium]